MQRHSFEFLGQQVELWTHPEPDHLTRVIRATGTWYEVDVLMKCREIYIPGTTILDVGANIGNHAVFFGLVLGAEVHAFEPYEPNYALLELNIAVNGLGERVFARCCAVGDSDGVGFAELGRLDNLGTVRICRGGGNIPMKRLDALDVTGPIGIIKIDVEGAETAVLRGAESLIRTWHPDILVEAERPDQFSAVTEILLNHGYAPRGRYAWTATYLFSATDQTTRMRAILDGLTGSTA